MSISVPCLRRPSHEGVGLDDVLAAPGGDRRLQQNPGDAFVNYATLGYGDVVPVERWRLLGPMAAMNGVLLFGWSTAVIFEVMRQAMRVRDQKGEP